MNNKHSLFVMVFLFSMFLIYSTQYSFGDTGVITIDSHDVKYDINNGNVESIFLDPDFFELRVIMNTHADGTISITIPRELLDAKFELTDDMFFVLVDSFETTYIESESNPNSRTLVIPFFNGDSTIEIIGTHVSNPLISNTEIKIPDWIKNNAGWWADGLIKDSDFVSGIQYLITNGIMHI